MTSFRIRSAAAGSVALLALLLTACDDAAETPEEPNSEAAESSDDGAAEAEPASELEDEAPEAEEPAGEAGSRENPLQLGETVASEDWAVTINSVTFDADDQVAAENQFNDPAPEEHSYALVHSDATYTGEDSDMVMMGVEIAYVADSGETINAWDSMAIAPDELDSAAELYNGGSASGNVALAVPEDGDGLIRVRLGFLDQEEAFFTTQ